MMGIYAAGNEGIVLNGLSVKYRELRIVLNYVSVEKKL